MQHFDRKFLESKITKYRVRENEHRPSELFSSEVDVKFDVSVGQWEILEEYRHELHRSYISNYIGSMPLRIHKKDFDVI